MNNVTTIQVYRETADIIESLKVHPRQSNAEILEEIVNYYKQNKKEVFSENDAVEL